MITSKELTGLGVAMVTPFTKEKKIDFQALDNNIEYLIEGGADYLVALGTTGETATLSIEEQEKVATFIHQQVKGRVSLLIGAGGNNTSYVIERIKSSNIIQKYDGLMIVTPYYNKPSQEGLYCHYKTIAEKVKTQPIVLYNVPGRTGVNMSSKTTLCLANQFNNIIAVKEASGDMTQVSHIINEKPAHFELISGDDGLALPMISVGAIGLISVLANALTQQVSELIKWANCGQYLQAQNRHIELFELMQAIFYEGNPTGIKKVMAIQGLIKNELRLPLIKASKELGKNLEELLLKLK